VWDSNLARCGHFLFMTLKDRQDGVWLMAVGTIVHTYKPLKYYAAEDMIFSLIVNANCVS
jgi:hypothetical protein